MKLISVRTAVAGALLGASLSGCVITPVPVRATVVAPGVGVEVVAPTAPPPLQFEAVRVPPSPGYFWIGGAWFWEGGRYAWRPGHWEAPRPGYRWVPHAWVQTRGGWHMHPGHWVARG